MKKFLLILLIFFGIYSTALAEQYVLVCKIKVSAVNALTDAILKTYVIDRYFIYDTVMQGVYDANNLPLNVHEFNDKKLVFSKRAFSFADIVDTRITYDRVTHKMTLNEIYGYASKYDRRAQFVTKGEGSCQEIKINRKPTIYDGGR